MPKQGEKADYHLSERSEITAICDLDPRKPEAVLKGHVWLDMPYI